MNPHLHCWKCGKDLDALPTPFTRREECPACRTELHVCRMCAFYDPRVARSCREPVADDVADKARANFCGYFQPAASLPRQGGRAGSDIRKTELEALFGTTPQCNGEDAAAAARQKLETLFGTGNKH